MNRLWGSKSLDTTFDFVVIGAGIAGASAGYELSQHGRVVVLEREDAPGRHSTGRSAAMFIETYGNAGIRCLTRASREFYHDPPEGFCDHPLLSPRGVMMIADEGQMDALTEFEAEIGAPAAGIDRLSCDEAVDLVAILKPDAAAAAVLEHDASDIDVHALHQGYLKGLRKRGGQLVVNAEVSALRRDGGAWVVETHAGTFSAPVVVNAAGAWSDELAKLAGARPVGLVPKRRTAITIDAPDDVETGGWPVVADIGESFYFKPESGRLMVSPADETEMPPCDVQPDELDVAITVDRFETATGVKVSRIEHKWAGLRSFVADKCLVIGFDDEVEGFFWLAGQGGYGIQTAPAAARTAAGLIVSGALPDDVAATGLESDALAPDRPALQRRIFQP